MKEIYRLFQKKLVTYCSPTLSHLKVASLFAIDKREIENYQECIRYFNRSLRTYQLSLMILKNKQNRLLIYLYHYNQLKYLLSKKEIKLFLHERHYPTNCLHATLGRLKCNLMSDSFPHEIGIFICDGEGFIKMYDEIRPDAGHLDEYTDSSGEVHLQPVLVSLNKRYAPRVIDSSNDFRIVGRVLN